MAITTEPSVLDVARLEVATFIVVIHDLSDPNVEDRAAAHTIYLAPLEFNPAEAPGWSAKGGGQYFTLKAGQRAETQVALTPGPTVKSVLARAGLHATLRSTLGLTVNASEEVVARVLPFSLTSVDIAFQPPRVQPFGQVRIPVTLRNDGLYPETYQAEARGPPGWFVSAPSSLTLFPGEARTLFINVVTPAERVFTPEQTGIINVRLSSTLSPGVVYERSAVVILEGVFLPDYWLPVLLLGAVVGSLSARRGVEGARRAAREQGRPGSRRLTPAQRVMLADLKHRDPERHKQLVAGQRRAQKLLQGRFQRVRGRRVAIERAMVDRQHAEAREVKAEEKDRAKLLDARERELERRRADIERERSREARDEAQEQRARERAARSVERKLAARQAREARREARHPEVRRREREQRLRERQLRAELAKKRAVLKKQEQLRKVAAERRRRQLLKRKHIIERRAKRRAKRGGGRGGEGGEGPEGGG